MFYNLYVLQPLCSTTFMFCNLRVLRLTRVAQEVYHNADDVTRSLLHRVHYKSLTLHTKASRYSRCLLPPFTQPPPHPSGYRRQQRQSRCCAYDTHVTRHTSHVTRHTSHVTRHTSHVTRHSAACNGRKAEEVPHILQVGGGLGVGGWGLGVGGWGLGVGGWGLGVEALS